MKFINKKKNIIVLLLLSSLFIVGCGRQQTLKNEFPVYNIRFLSAENPAVSHELLTLDLCVPQAANIANDQLDNPYIGGAGFFDVTAKTVPYGKNLFTKMYPASTTKILTALIVLEKCKLDEVVTVSELATELPNGAVGCNLNAGDQITVEQLLHGLLLVSGNDCAVALAEHVSGSVPEFATLMNKKCRDLGATHSNFVNPNGLHVENHFSTIYDMYLIFNACIKNEEFLKIIHTSSFLSSYLDKNGKSIEHQYETTNLFLTGEEKVPKDVIILGGKTGTTFDAGKCLILLSQNKVGNQQISIVLKADSKEILFHYMRKMLEEFSNL